MKYCYIITTCIEMIIVTFIVNALLVCDQVMHGKRDFNIYAMHDVC